MSSVLYAGKGHVRISRQQTLRYLGYGTDTPKGPVSTLIDNCIEETQAVLSCRACYHRFSLSVDEKASVVCLGALSIGSKSLTDHLKGCREAILFAATAGHEIDRLIQKYERISPAKAVAVQAAGAAAVEAWCDLLCRGFAEESRACGCFLRPRFSPGYGDLSLAIQPELFRLLDCEKKIGLSLSEGMLMLPTKSVSAIVGIGAERHSGVSFGCSVCSRTHCAYRKEDES